MLETTSGTIPPSSNDRVLFVVYILVPTVLAAFVLCLLIGLTAACIWRASWCKKKKAPVSSNRADCVYDDITVGPVYETIDPLKSLVDGAKVTMTTNEAYKTIPLKRTNVTSLDVDVVNAKAHDTSGTGLILMEKNNSYQITVPKHF